MSKTKINKAIILAGGVAKRLRPLTEVVSKHLLPIYNKPMIYYPISILIEAGIKNYLIITKKEDLEDYKKLLGDGKKFGIKINYKVQKKPNGLPEALILGEKFINNEPICINLGDHIFFGPDVSRYLKDIVNNFHTSTVFSYSVDKPNAYGVIEKQNGKNYKIVEKPKKTNSNDVVCGLYFYTPEALKVSKKLKKSKRGELEITELNNYFLSKSQLIIKKISNKNHWIDAGTPDKLLFASKVIAKQENKNNIIGSIEVESIKNKFITVSDFKKIIKSYNNNSYSTLLNKYYLHNLKK